MGFRDMLNRLIRDEELLRDIRLWIAIALPFAMAFVYWLFVQNADFNSQINVRDFGFLTLIYYVGLIILTVDTNDRTFYETYNDEENEQSKEWREVESEIKAQAPKPEDLKYSLSFIQEQNKLGQKDANQALTNEAIEKIYVQISKAQSKGNAKKVQELYTLAEQLEKPENWLHNKKYVPLYYGLLASTGLDGDSVDQSWFDATSIKSNVRKQGRRRMYLTALLKSVWFGGAIAFSVGWDGSLLAKLVFLAGLAIMQVMTIASVTKSTRAYIYDKHISKRRNKKDKMKEMQEYIKAQKSAEQKDTDPETEVDGGNILAERTQPE